MSTSGHMAHSLSVSPPLFMHFKSCTRLDRRRLTRPRNGQLNGQSGCRRRRRPCRSCRHNKNVLGAGSSSEAGTACGKDKCTTNSCTSVAHFNKVNCILALCAAAEGVAEGRGKVDTMGNGTEAARSVCAPSLFVVSPFVGAFHYRALCFRQCLRCPCYCPVVLPVYKLRREPSSPTPTPAPLSLHVQLIIIYFNELPNRISNVAALTATRLRCDSSLK